MQSVDFTGSNLRQCSIRHDVLRRSARTYQSRASGQKQAPSSAATASSVRPPHTGATLAVRAATRPPAVALSDGLAVTPQLQPSTLPSTAEQQSHGGPERVAAVLGALEAQRPPMTWASRVASDQPAAPQAIVASCAAAPAATALSYAQAASLAACGMPAGRAALPSAAHTQPAATGIATGATLEPSGSPSLASDAVNSAVDDVCVQRQVFI